LPADRTKYLRETIWKTLNDKEFVAWSKEAKREIDILDGEATEKALNKVMQGYTDYKDVLKKYVK
jgi:tripartite-type tricarboxylate transporter receptor subunit TctC